GGAGGTMAAFGAAGLPLLGVWRTGGGRGGAAGRPWTAFGGAVGAAVLGGVGTAGATRGTGAPCGGVGISDSSSGREGEGAGGGRPAPDLGRPEPLSEVGAIYSAISGRSSVSASWIWRVASTDRWMSCSESPEDRLMVVVVRWPVSMSAAVTLTMPSVLISKFTSIFASPR